MPPPVTPLPDKPPPSFTVKLGPVTLHVPDVSNRVLALLSLVIILIVVIKL